MCEAEVMRRSVLPYQFTAGLVPEIKHKIAGCTSTSKELFSEHELRRLNDADRCNALDASSSRIVVVWHEVRDRRTCMRVPMHAGKITECAKLWGHACHASRSV